MSPQRTLVAHPAAASSAELCGHCGNPVPGSRSDGFCCAGCHAVHRLLHEAGMGQYYQLRPLRTLPRLGYFDWRPSLDWLEQSQGLKDGRLELQVEGIHCGACVWALEKLAARHGGARVGVNSTLGRLSLNFQPGIFHARAYLEQIADLGYRAQPLGSPLPDPSRDLLLRLGVCAALAMNTMLLSLPFYLGMRPSESGALGPALRGLGFALTLAAVLYGGGYFFTRAWRSLRAGVAHFDIPVALGLGAAFLGSAWAALAGRGDTIYFDSVNVFLTLMLAGRFAQERALQLQRRALLRADTFAQARCTLLLDRGARDLPFPAVKAGDRLLLQPGGLCPAEAVLQDGPTAEFDRAAITGEARPAALRPGDPVAAGARLVSAAAVQVLCVKPFSDGLLARLGGAGGEEELPVVWRWAVRWYTGLVLAAAAGGGLWWWLHDPAKAPQVFIATLVVTCPCGLGVAAPLARTLADRRLAAAGLLPRRSGLLERLRQVRRVCLDKTGTLTFSHLELADPDALERLAPAAREALMGAVASSLHPVSRSLFRELAARGEPYPSAGQAEEVPGQGVRWTDRQGVWFLGRDHGGAAGRVRLSLDGKPVASLELRERLLEDSAPALARLRRRGLRVELLSGDDPARVRATAVLLGLPPEAARGGCGPEAKALAVAECPTLMLGDGLNDDGALRAATAGGTPAWDRSVVADAADFNFAGASLAWLPELFDTSDALRRVLWGNLAFALAYNLALLSLALRGSFSPLLCAVTMPASSLLVIALTLRGMRRP
ncbi:MAG TPA: heavy metal translocating P-type ATPase metal-binding domain-containing protein [bacterium]|nr:heavy metal translocating P-type ATPase metal-binding domain-containing protein [bacterium]